MNSFFDKKEKTNICRYLSKLIETKKWNKVDENLMYYLVLYY